MGKTELNTLSRPVSSRSPGSRSICRNRSYDFFWTSMRLGIGIDVLIREKSTRSRVTPFARFCILHSYGRTARDTEKEQYAIGSGTTAPMRRPGRAGSDRDG